MAPSAHRGAKGSLNSEASLASAREAASAATIECARERSEKIDLRAAVSELRVALAACRERPCATASAVAQAPPELLALCAELDDAVDGCGSYESLSAAEKDRIRRTRLQQYDPADDSDVGAVLREVFAPPPLGDPCPDGCKHRCMSLGPCVCQIRRHRARRESAPRKLAAKVVELSGRLRAALSATAVTHAVADARARAEAAEQRAAAAEQRARRATAAAEARAAEKRAASDSFFGARDPRECFSRVKAELGDAVASLA